MAKGAGKIRRPAPDILATAQLHRDWLKALPSLTGLSLSKIADEAKIARTTLTDKVTPDDPGTSTLHPMVIEKIVRALGVAPPGSVQGPATPFRRPPRGMAEEAIPFKLDDLTPLAAAVRAMIAGREHVMPVTLATRAIEAAGYLPGDVLIYDLNAKPAAGDVVRAQVYDRNGDILETVWRLYDPPFLIGASRDLSVLPKPLVVDNERVVIMGGVVGMIRPPHASAA